MCRGERFITLWTVRSRVLQASLWNTMTTLVVGRLSAYTFVLHLQTKLQHVFVKVRPSVRAASLGFTSWVLILIFLIHQLHAECDKGGHSAHFIRVQSALKFIRLKENNIHIPKLAWKTIGLAVLMAHIVDINALWRTLQVTPYAAKIFTFCNAILKQMMFSLSSRKINTLYTKYWSQFWKNSNSALKNNHTNLSVLCRDLLLLHI